MQNYTNKKQRQNIMKIRKKGRRPTERVISIYNFYALRNSINYLAKCKVWFVLFAFTVVLVLMNGCNIITFAIDMPVSFIQLQPLLYVNQLTSTIHTQITPIKHTKNNRFLKKKKMLMTRIHILVVVDGPGI